MIQAEKFPPEVIDILGRIEKLPSIQKFAEFSKELTECMGAVNSSKTVTVHHPAIRLLMSKIHAERKFWGFC